MSDDIAEKRSVDMARRFYNTLADQSKGEGDKTRFPLLYALVRLCSEQLDASKCIHHIQHIGTVKVRSEVVTATAEPGCEKCQQALDSIAATVNRRVNPVIGGAHTEP